MLMASKNSPFVIQVAIQYYYNFESLKRTEEVFTTEVFITSDFMNITKRLTCKRCEHSTKGVFKAKVLIFLKE